MAKSLPLIRAHYFWDNKKYYVQVLIENSLIKEI